MEHILPIFAGKYSLGHKQLHNMTSTGNIADNSWRNLTHI